MSTSLVHDIDIENVEAPTGTFADKEGAVWDVSLTLAGARRIDNSDFSALGVKEFSILRPDEDLFNTILLDQPVMFAMLWAVVQPQVLDNLGIDPRKSPEDAEEAEGLFLERIDAKAKAAAQKAFWATVSDFFPEHQTVLAELMLHLEQMHARMGAKLKAQRKEIQVLVNQEMDEGLGDAIREARQSLADRRKARKKRLGKVSSAS